MKALNYILSSYKWESTHDFFMSIFPSLKIEGLIFWTISFSGIIGVVSDLFGMGQYAIIGLVVALFLELTSGIYCSVWIRNEPFESKKLSRFFFKVAMLVGVLFCAHSFHRDYNDGIAGLVFENLNTIIVVYSIWEIMLSVLENKAEIDGKPKNYYSQRIKEKIDKIFGNAG